WYTLANKFSMTSGTSGVHVCPNIPAGSSFADPGDFVWRDLNVNGIQDPGEPGIGGVTVNLYSAGPDGLGATADDQLLATQVTDGLGLYDFTYVPTGSYYVQFLAPAGQVFTL